MSDGHVVIEERAFKEEQPRTARVTFAMGQLILNMIDSANRKAESVGCFLRREPHVTICILHHEICPPCM